MGSKKIRPVTPGMRSQVATDFKDITKKKPEKSLLESKNHPVVEITKEELLQGTEVEDTNKNIE